MKTVLEERGISTVGKNANWMHQELANHHDFKNEMSMVERFLVQKGYVCVLLPKFHPKLNHNIERIWTQLKRFTKRQCKYTLPSLRKNMPLAHDTVTLDNTKNHFRKVCHYIFK